jgi:hypothetical protein
LLHESDEGVSCRSPTSSASPRGRSPRGPAATRGGAP